MILEAKLPSLPMIPGVRFKLIPGFEGYAVGDDGSVWSSKCNRKHGRKGAFEWRPIKVWSNNEHYGYVTLYKPGKSLNRYERRKITRVARLVLEAFVGPGEPGMEACHFPDSNRMNNRVSNLRWETHKTNIGHAIEQGTHCSLLKSYTDEQEEKILWLLNTGSPHGEIAAIVGVDRSSVHRLSQKVFGDQKYPETEGCKRRRSILKAWDNLLATPEEAAPCQ